MKINQIILFLITVLVVKPFTGNSQQLAQQYNLRQKSAFIENKGQVVDQNGIVRKDVKYMYSAPGFKLVLKSNNFSYEVYTLEKKKKEQAFPEALGYVPTTTLDKFKEPEEATVKTHRVDVSFVEANPNPGIIVEERSNDYNNYYLAHTPEEGITNIYSFSKLTYKNLYPNIDIVWYAKEEGNLKYDIVVHPGGKLEDVKMKYSGMNGLSLNIEKLKISTSIGEAEEKIPYSFLKEDKQQVHVKYMLENNQISFIGNYNKSKTLVIDPIITWGTYYGGNNRDQSYDISKDSNSNLYITGIAESTAGIATSGAHQTSKGNGYFGDVFIVKFNSKGIRQWGTYYGGSGVDIGNGIRVDDSSNINVSGMTSSSSGIATSGAHQTSFQGGAFDAFVAKFNSNGIRDWGTYCGGGSDEYIYGINKDRSNNIYITGYTNSGYGIATSGAHQTSSQGGTHDAFLVKFNSSGVRQWGTYYGGNGIDRSWTISTDRNNNVYITGYTSSSSGIATTGSYRGGTYDAFIAKFNSSGVRQWGIYYGGNSIDQARTIIADSKNNIYVAGFTASSSGIATTSSFQSTFTGGSSDVFLVKFNSSGVRQWGTYYGGDGGDDNYGIYADDSSNVYITGFTTSTYGIATKSVYQTSLKGNYDAYLAKFNSNGDRKWGTYYGGSYEDFGYGICTDDSTNVYLTGYTASDSGIAVTSAHQSARAGNNDAFLAKFPDMYCGITFSINGDITVCSGATQIYTSLKSTGLSYEWKVVGGAILAGQGTDNIKVIWGSADTGNITVIIRASRTCIDSTNQIIIINSLPNAVTDSASTVCSGQSTSIGGTAVSGNIYSWTSKPIGFTSTNSNPIVFPVVTTTYYLTETISSTGCNKTDSVTVTVIPPVSNNIISSTQIICSGQTAAQLTGSNPVGGGGGYSYQWERSTISDTTGFTSITGATSSNYTPGILTTTTYFRRTVTTPTCIGAQKSVSSAVKITVHPPLSNNSVSSSQVICSGQVPVHFTGGIVNGGAGSGTYNYLWQDSATGSMWRTVGKNADYSPGKIDNNGFGDSIIYFRRIVTSEECAGAQSSISNEVHLRILARLRRNIISSSQIICSGQVSSMLKGDTVTGGNGIYQYQWQDSITGGNWKTISKTADYAAGAIINGSPTTDSVIYFRRIVTSGGCNGAQASESNIITITVLPLLVPIITGNTMNCVGTAVNYSVNLDSGITASWLVTGGNIIAGQGTGFITIKWSIPGTEIVKVIVTNKTNCTDSAFLNVTINALPIADFSFNNTCFGDSVHFINTSTSASSYLWSFGDGTTTAIANPKHKYVSTGTVAVKLKVWNSVGCSDSISKTITINPLPAVAISFFKDTITPRTYIFSSVNEGSNYLWSFGDGTIDSGKTVKHTYQKDSTYKITLAVRDSNGCTAIEDTTLTVFTVGINEIQVKAFDVKLYPNPFSHSTTLEYELHKREKVVISLYNLAGKEIDVIQSGFQKEGKYSYKIEANEYQLKAGIYLLKVIAGSRIITRQLVKVKEYP